MEALIEILLEVFLELFFECIAAGISKLASWFDKKDKLRNKLFYILLYTFYGLCILLFTLSIIYNKSLLVIIVLSYLLVCQIISLLKSINKNHFRKKYIDVILITFKTIIKYAFPIVLIVFGAIYLTHAQAKTWLIVLSCLGILLYFIIDIYRLTRLKINK